MARIAALAIVIALMGLALFASSDAVIFADARSTMTFGFLLLAAYLIGDVLSRFKLPKITGYILAGILFGPHLLDFVSADTVRELKLIDDLALTFIAFAAGGELRLEGLRERRKSITLTVLLLTVSCSSAWEHSSWPPAHSCPFSTASRKPTPWRSHFSSAPLP